MNCAPYRAFRPNENAPEFVMGTVVVTMKDFLDYWKAHPELQTDFKDKNGEVKKQMRLQLLLSKAGGLYAKVDDYKPEAQPEGRKPTRPAPAGSVTAAANSSASTNGAAPVPEDDLPF